MPPMQSGVWSLKPSAVVSRTFAQPMSMLFAVTYLMFEYVRPQALYPVIDFLPWGISMLMLGIGSCVLEGRISFTSWKPWTLLALFTAIILISSINGQYPKTSFFFMDIWWSWIFAIFLLSSAMDTKEKLLLGLGAFMLYNLKMSQHAVFSWASAGFAFVRVGASGSPGWFRNSGEFGIAMCVFFPIATYYLLGLWPALSRNTRLFMAGVALTAVIGMIASSSRGAQLGGAVLALWFVLRSPYRLRMLVVMGILAGLVWLAMPPESKARWAAAGTDPDSIRRLTYWTDGIKIANEFPIFGIGYKSWIQYYRARYNPDGEVQHNIFVECVSELGYVGLLMFLVLIGYVLRENARVRKLTGPKGVAPDRFLYHVAFGLDGALIGYLASGFFVTVLFYPFFWINMAFVMALGRVTDAQVRRVRAPAARPTGGPRASLARRTFGPGAPVGARPPVPGVAASL